LALLTTVEPVRSSQGHKRINGNVHRRY